MHIRVESTDRHRCALPALFAVLHLTQLLGVLTVRGARDGVAAHRGRGDLEYSSLDKASLLELLVGGVAMVSEEGNGVVHINGLLHLSLHLILVVDLRLQVERVLRLVLRGPQLREAGALEGVQAAASGVETLLRIVGGFVRRSRPGLKGDRFLGCLFSKEF